MNVNKIWNKTDGIAATPHMCFINENTPAVCPECLLAIMADYGVRLTASPTDDIDERRFSIVNDNIAIDYLTIDEVVSLFGRTFVPLYTAYLTDLVSREDAMPEKFRELFTGAIANDALDGIVEIFWNDIHESGALAQNVLLQLPPVSREERENVTRVFISA